MGHLRIFTDGWCESANKSPKAIWTYCDTRDSETNTWKGTASPVTTVLSLTLSYRAGVTERTSGTQSPPCWRDSFECTYARSGFPFLCLTHCRLRLRNRPDQLFTMYPFGQIEPATCSAIGFHPLLFDCQN